MRKHLLSLCTLAATPFGASATGLGNPVHGVAPKARKAAAADNGFAVGTNVVNLGVGFGNRYAIVFTESGGSSTPALSFSYERGITELGGFVLGVGLFAGYQSSSYSYSFGSANFKQSTSDLIVNLRRALHYPVSGQLDAYGGLGIGTAT